VRDEHIVYVGRKHVILMLGQIITEIILIGLTLVAFSVVTLVFTKYNMTQNVIQVIVYGALGLATTVLVVSGVLDYLKWHNDCVVLTNRRMMRFEGLFNRHMVESVLDKINDVTLNQTFWGRVFGYGDVTVLTAAESGIQEMRNIAKPIEFKQALFHARSSGHEHQDDHEDNGFDSSHVVARDTEYAVNEDTIHEQSAYPDDRDQSIHHDMSDSDALAPTPAHGNEDLDEAQEEAIDEAAEERATILRQLEILHAKGILDDDEFNTKIQRLYGKDDK
jgi:uncharacterized membrane protein YdbT with pleckstrin-like domain